MMRFSAFAVSILLAFAACPASAEAAQATGLTRIGNYIGAKHIVITKSLEEDMVRAGIPDQCRKEAHEVLTQFVDYGWDVMPHNHPTLDILCEFKATAPGNAKGMIGKSIGQRGTVGGVRYVHFVSDIRNVQRYILAPESAKSKQASSSLFGQFLQFVQAAPAGAARNIPCTAGASCGNAALNTTPLPGAAARAFALPVSAAVGSQFGARTRPCSTCSAMHKGQDYRAACGTPIQAAGDGTIITSRFQAGGAGNYCQIRHENGVVTEYFHMPNLSQCALGAKVTQGQQIGTVGSTGASTGCHLHFGTQVNGQRVDPRTVLGQATNVPLTPGQANDLMGQIATADDAVARMRDYDAKAGAAGKKRNDCASGASVFCDHANDDVLEPEMDDEDGHDEHGDDPATGATAETAAPTGATP